MRIERSISTVQLIGLQFYSLGRKFSFFNYPLELTEVDLSLDFHQVFQEQEIEVIELRVTAPELLSNVYDKIAVEMQTIRME